MVNMNGLAHIAIQAQNFEETILFYEKALDFEVVHQWSLPEFNLKKAAMLKSKINQTMIEIFDKNADIATQGRKRKSGEDFVSNAILHFAINVDNVTTAYNKALSYGAKECIPPSFIELGSKEMTVENALIYSPNGEVIEFIKESIF